MLNKTKPQINQTKSLASKTFRHSNEWKYRFIRIFLDRKYQLKIKLPITKRIDFLDEINFGESETNVRKILGSPHCIYQNSLSDQKHSIYIYKLRSGSNKLKVELHFLEKYFFLGTIFYLIENANINDLNLYFKNTYGLDFLHFKRDILVDPQNNFIEFHDDPNYFIMTFTKMNWINSLEIFQNCK